MAWDVLTSADYGADVILTEATATALYDNPRAMAQRESSTPSLVQVPVAVFSTAAASWTWADGATAATFYLQAAGGEGGDGGANGSNGGDTTITYNSVTYTANGGDGGADGSLPATGRGGTGGTGDLVIRGKTANTGIGGDSYFGEGGGLLAPTNGGGGGGNGGQGGSGGEMVRVRIAKVVGLNTVTISLGAGGTGSSAGQAGAGGCILIEY